MTRVITDMEIWVEVRRRVLTGELSKRAACREYEIHWQTLEKILSHSEPPGYQQTKPRSSIVDVPLIEEMLKSDRQVHRKQRHTARRIFERLRDEHGYVGGETIVKDAVREWKQHHREVFLPLSHPPGEAQVDFGFADVWLAGELTKVALFVMTLPYSDAIFIQAFPRECTEAFLEGHRRAFEFFGGVPTRISYDNSKIAVASITGSRERKVTREFQRLNRLIAATLERRWESAMEELEQARSKLKEAETVPPVTAKVSAADRKLFADAGTQMPELWPRLSLDSRKQLLRTLICGVNLNRGDAGCVKIRIVWRGGLVTELNRQVPIMSQKYSSLEKLVAQRIRELASIGQTLDEIAASLNQEGFVPCRGGQFTAIIVSKLKHQYGIVSGLEQIRRGTRPKGTYTAAEVAEQLGVERSWIYRKISRGQIRIDKNEAFGCYLFPKSKQTINDLKRLKLGKCAHVSIQKVHHES